MSVIESLERLQCEEPLGEMKSKTFDIIGELGEIANLVDKIAPKFDDGLEEIKYKWVEARKSIMLLRAAIINKMFFGDDNDNNK